MPLGSGWPPAGRPKESPALLEQSQMSGRGRSGTGSGVVELGEVRKGGAGLEMGPPVTGGARTK